MSLETRLLDRLESVPDTFIGMVNKQNEALWRELLKLLDELEYKDGVIVNSAVNLAKSEEIVSRLQQVMFGGDYLEGLREFITEFDQQTLLVNGYMGSSFDNFTSDKALYDAVVNQSKKTTLALFDQSAIDKQWADPLRKIFQDNIIVQGTRADMLKVLETYVKGSPEREARLSRYVGTIARDSFNIFNRNYTMMLSEELGVNNFRYAGGTVKDSRDFCIARAGRIFDKKTIESWASQTWQGKNPATDEKTIFSYAGGYNCMHSILPVSDENKGAFFNEVRKIKK